MAIRLITRDWYGHAGAVIHKAVLSSLVTNNLKPFPSVPGLKVKVWQMQMANGFCRYLEMASQLI